MELMKSFHSEMHCKEIDMAEEKHVPIKKYAFPAGACGGEIRINIPLFATKEDVETAAAALMVVAERWKETT